MLYVVYTLSLLCVSLSITAMHETDSKELQNPCSNVELLSEEQKASLLFEAVKNNDVTAVRSLCSSIKDINAHYNEKIGFTSLMWAAAQGNKEIIALLLKHGARTEIRNVRKMTALSYAAENGHLEIVKMLLDSGAYSDVQRNDGETPLISSIKDGHKEVAKLLIARGANVSLQDNIEHSALDAALKLADKELINLIVRADVHINEYYMSGYTRLISSLKYHYAREGALLLDTDIDVNAPSKDGDTPLIVVSEQGNLKAVELLLQKKADVNSANKKGTTALMMAVIHGYKEIAALLIKAGADCNACNSYGYTPLKFADGKNHKEIVRLLELSNTPEVQAYLKNPQAYAQKECSIVGKTTPLMLACIFGHYDVISSFKNCPRKYLIESDDSGYTAFDYAFMFNIRSVATLIHTFEKKDIVYTFGKNAVASTYDCLEKAIESKNTEAVSALLGIDIVPSFGIVQGIEEAGYFNVLPKDLFVKLLFFTNS